MLQRIMFVLLAIMLVTQLSACGFSKETSSSSEQAATSKEVATDAQNESVTEEEPLIIVDQMGRVVEIPKEINRIVMTALPFPSIYALTGEPISKIVGMHPGSKGAIENSIMGKMYPELLEIESTFIEGTDLNMEELLKLNPDIVFYWGSYENQTKQLTEAGIPAIGVVTQGDGDPLLTLSSWLEMMGQVFGKEHNVKEVIDYGKQVEEEIKAQVADLSEEERVRGLYLYNHDEKQIIVSGGDHYGHYWLETTGGVNMAKELKGTATVSMEQIYQWNPEVIYISSFTTTMPEDILENKIAGQDWSQIEAVKNGRVYKEPVGVYRWYPPSGDAPLMLKWMANHQYPGLFSYDMEKELKEYYQRFYRYELTDEDIEWILNPVRETASGASGFGGSRR